MLEHAAHAGIPQSGAASASSKPEARRRKPRHCRARVDQHAKAAGRAAGDTEAHESGTLQSVDEEGRGVLGHYDVAERCAS